MADSVFVVIGTGGMGAAVARRLGTGRITVLADYDRGTVEALASQMEGQGYDVRPQVVDISKRESVRALAHFAAAQGEVTGLVHTAGVSPVQAPVSAVLSVDLLGTAYILDEFGSVISDRGAGVVISSMGGHFVDLPKDVELQLATTPADDLLSLPCVSDDALRDSGAAYSLAKKANQLRVQSESLAWGRRGARINSISPGIICTPMGRAELEGDDGANMRMMIDASAARRMGTPEDIAAAAEFLMSPSAGFITGTDLLVDGGVVAAVRGGRLGA